MVWDLCALSAAHPMMPVQHPLLTEGVCREHYSLLVQDRLSSTVLMVQDSDERAVAYIAGKAPSRWGRFGVDPPVAAPMMVLSPQVLPPNASSAQIDRNTQIRRSHPLYADVALRLLTEIMNSRLFTTVRSSPVWPVRLTCYDLECSIGFPTE